MAILEKTSVVFIDAASRCLLPFVTSDRTPSTLQRLAIAGSTSSLIGKYFASRTVFEMATLSPGRFLVLRFPD